MLYATFRDFQGHESFYLSRNLFLAAIPLILCISFLSGTAAFFLGSGIENVFARETRRAELPIAGDRFVVFAQTTRPSIQPVAVRTASAGTVLAPVTTAAAGNFIHIPSINVHVPLVLATSLNDTDILSVLTKGVALYPNGVRPGQKGNVFISGHSTGLVPQGAYRFAFLNLGKLKKGDAIQIDLDGTRYTYRMTGARTVNPREVRTLDSSGTRSTLSIMSCWPLWTAAYRLVVDAELIAVNPLLVEGTRAAEAMPLFVS